MCMTSVNCVFQSLQLFQRIVASAPICIRCAWATARYDVCAILSRYHHHYHHHDLRISITTIITTIIAVVFDYQGVEKYALEDFCVCIPLFDTIGLTASIYKNNYMYICMHA